MKNKCTSAKISMTAVTATVLCTINMLEIGGLATFTKVINKDMEKLTVITDFSGRENI